MLDYIKSQFFGGTELRKVQEQYKEFFIFLNRYGYRLISKDIRIIHENRIGYNLDDHTFIEGYDTIDFKCIELVFERTADFVSIGKLFQEQTNIALPLYPDLNANQFLGIRLLRQNNKYNPYYEVNRMGFEVLSSKYTTTHYRLFRTGRTVFPWIREPYGSYSQDYLDNKHIEVMTECVKDLIRSIEFYNTNKEGDDWYISYMKTKHPDSIPILNKVESTI